MKTKVIRNRCCVIASALPYLRVAFICSCVLVLSHFQIANADSSNKIPASQIVVKNSKLGLNSTRGMVTLQDLLTRLHKPARAYFGGGDGANQDSTGLPGRTWSGTARAVCFKKGEFKVMDYPTRVTFETTSGGEGHLIATPSFANVPGSDDLCKIAPDGTQTASFLVDGNDIHVADHEGSHGVYSIEIIDGVMRVGQAGSSWSWILKQAGQ